MPEVRNEENNGAPNIPPVAPKVLHEFLIEHPTVVFKYVFKKLNQAINQDNDEVILFNMPHLGSSARIERKDYQIALEKMIEHYITIEEYERIVKCQSLITQHSINEIIRSSKQM